MSPPRQIPLSPPDAPLGFSLIELLVVVAILGILAAVTLPAFSNIGQARGVTEAAYQIAGAVDYAREEARNRRGYVWLGIVTNSDGLRVGAAMSRDGSANTNDLVPIMRPIILQKVTLAGTAGLGLPGLPPGTVDFSTQSGGANFSGGFTNGKTLTITPEGEVLTVASPTDTNGFVKHVAVGLELARGNASDNAAAVLIDGSAALPKILRK